VSTTERSDTPGRMMGYGGLLLASAGAVPLIVLGQNAALAIGISLPLGVTAVVASLPATRDTPIVWLVTGIWTGAIGVLTIFSMGIIFLIATVFLLAAFLRANW
jgi:hypothetical protein